MSAILLDIEGTTTDKSFVLRTLFPYARARISAFLAAHAAEPAVAGAIAEMRRALGDPKADVRRVGAELERWIDEDRKLEPLKTLQGLLWAEGYERGELLAHVYDDVPQALARWRAGGRRIAIFSSGSVAAQRLLFAHAGAGDLTGHIEAYFDLGTGPKFEPSSYGAIAEALEEERAGIRFYSDAPREIEAALEAGLEAVLVERDGPIDAPAAWRRVQSFAGEEP